MYLEKIILSNFLCFSEQPTEIILEKDLTCFIGNNGAGKTAVMKSLQRLFGNTIEERTIKKSDFHCSESQDGTNKTHNQLFIEAIFRIEEKDGDLINATISSVFYASTDAKQEYKVKVRLEAEWSEDEYEDEVKSSIFWVLGDDAITFGEDSPIVIRMENHERKMFNFIYTPATRNAKNILIDNIRSILKKLERYTNISIDEKTKIQKYSEKLNKKIEELDSIKSVTEIANNLWEKARKNTFRHYETISMIVLENKFEDLVKSLIIKLSPAENGEKNEIFDLSDGQISLLYFVLSLTLYEIETNHENNKLNGFKDIDYTPPIYTIFALEEPENHLSPFYLGKIINILKDKSTLGNFSSIITSHSPNIVKRFDKVEQIRFFIQEVKILSDNINDRCSSVKSIILPENKDDDDYKFLNQAVLAHPELYFSKLVILGEGESEEIIIPNIARKLEIDLDESFVSFVKLGGRHVNHMWRLLENINIPYITLIDFDSGRKTGGICRVEQIYQELLKNAKRNDENKNKSDNEIYKDMKIYYQIDENIDKNNIEQKVFKPLEELHNMFFSYPLDLDMMMINSFSDEYNDNGKDSIREDLIKSVLGKCGNESDYFGDALSNDILKKYRFLFKSKSKTVSHYVAIDKILKMNEDSFRQRCPAVLARLVNKCNKLISADK